MGIQLTPVQSSQISEIGHDPETNTLAIRFKGKGDAPGSLYHYKNFDADQFKAFNEAESKGKFFGAAIKPAVDKHPYTRIVEDKKDDQKA